MATPMYKVRCIYDNQGKLQADNSGCPGVTEADLVQVLTNWAAMAQDERHPWRWYATGPTDGIFSYLTVVFVRSQDRKHPGLRLEHPAAASHDDLGEIIALTAFPAKSRSMEEYVRLRKEEGLCIPASDTETP